METLLRLGSQSFQLVRLPRRKQELLRAWDAADEYLLETLLEKIKPAPEKRLLIFNDSFGALTLGLLPWQPTVISDSYLSQTATRLNLAENNGAETAITLLNSLEKPSGIFDFVIIKAPKTLAYLEDFLIRIQDNIHAETQFIIAGMIKNLPASLWTLIEKYLGQTTTSLAQKKARLIFATPKIKIQRQTFSNPYPICYSLENTPYQILNHANVFSRDKLDIGTRFLIEHLPTLATAKNIADLGCGNGIVGVLLAEKHPLATVHFVDESFMAVASAQHNFEQAFAHTTRHAQFTVGDGLTAFDKASMDLIVCNPPFHQQQTVGDQIAMAMFQQARQVLNPHGQFWVIGNRHLNYQQALKKRFAQVSVVAENPKFVIFKATC